MKDQGMKWVIIADLMAIVVFALLYAANYLEQKEAELNKNQLLATKEYEYVLPLTKEDCTDVNGTVDIVLITDSNYMDFTRVAINSAKETKCPASIYNFHIMTLDVSDSDVKALKALAGNGTTVSVLPQKEIDLFYIRDTHVSKTSLLKYYIADVLPNLDKVLFIDSDVLILHDLNKLYNTPLGDNYLAAVKDPSWFFQNAHVLELNLEKRGFYFNSGVMLLNLKQFRQDNLKEKLEDYTNNNFRTYMDQDALNVIVGDKVMLLPFEANAINFFFEHIDMSVLGEFYGRNWSTYDEVFAPAVILHFASSKKPLGPIEPKENFFRMLQKLWDKYYQPLPPLD